MHINYHEIKGVIPGKIYGEFSALHKVMPLPEQQELFCSKVNGYRGFWHCQPPEEKGYGYKYSGGLGTYSAKSLPFAVYCSKVNKTFFCWGGTPIDNTKKDFNFDFCSNQLYHMVSYYDHETGMVPRPTLLFDKYCGDAHDNPVISVDDEGYIWVFSPSHGEWTTRSYVHRSVEPYSIEKFETIMQSLFAYPQVHWLPRHGFVFMHTSYKHGRGLRVATSSDGINWDKVTDLALFGQGHYQVTNYLGKRIGSAFDYHPKEGGLHYRTNLYYIQSEDAGKTWATVDGKKLELPLKNVHNNALIYDYKSEGLKVYVKDIQFNKEGYPVILYLTTKGWESGPINNPRTWKIAKWTGNMWDFIDITTSDNNYDMGSLYVEEDGVYRIIAPTESGPQQWNPGGEVVIWLSYDEGNSWTRYKQITANSEFNHTFVRRPVNANPDFYGFWADGHTKYYSTSRLYFCTKHGDVFMLPPRMENDFEKPIKIK